MIKVNAEQEIFSVDAEQQLRGVLSKLKDYCDSLEPSNDQETFRIIIEKDRDSVLGSGNEEQWRIYQITMWVLVTILESVLRTW